MTDDRGSPDRPEKEILGFEEVLNREKITIDEITPSDSRIDKLDITRVGYRPAFGVFIYIVVVTALIFADYFMHAPSRLDLTSLGQTGLVFMLLMA